MRTFVALELSDAAKAGILAVIGRLRESGVRASWSRSSTIHLTLKFLGEVDDAEIAEVVEAVGLAARSSLGFGMTTVGLGAFPSPRRPRVVWAGVDAPEELFALQSKVDAELAALGFERERRRFHPHVTLGRLREPGADLGGLLRTVEVPRRTTHVDRVLVMKSTLAPSGAVHEAVAEVPLASARPSPGND